MRTIIEQLETAFRTAILSAVGVDSDPQLSVSQSDKFGDYQANAAMGLAKRLSESSGEKTNPRAIAEKIKAKLDLGSLASEVSIAGPGFLNVRLNPVWVARQVEVIANDRRLGVETMERPGTVVVDYSAPNVAKQMHVGHLRSTIIGDAISRALEFQGHRVIRRNHIGDWGTQFGMLITFLRDMSASGNSRIEDLDQFYKEARKRFDGEPAFADQARATVVRLQAGGAEELGLWRQIVEQSRNHFQPIYERLNVKLTAGDERGESFYNPLLSGVVGDLQAKQIATLSDGATVVFTEGLPAPLIIEKTGGGYGYATTDLAAIRHRTTEEGADRIIYVVGAPQAQHFRQVFDTAKKAGWAQGVVLEHAPFGSVLGEDGKMFKARSGDSVKLSELLDEAEERGYQLAKEKDGERVTKANERGETEVQPMPESKLREIGRAVGIGAVKYADLSKDRVGDYVFSWDKMLAMDGNTAPYLQYAYARIRSIFRRSGLSPDLSAAISLQTSFEQNLAKHLLRLGEVIELVSRELKPHHLCSYLYELATRFSAFYENCPVLQAESAVKSSRLVLCEATARTIALGLDLLGIEHPEQM